MRKALTTVMTVLHTKRKQICNYGLPILLSTVLLSGCLTTPTPDDEQIKVQNRPTLADLTTNANLTKTDNKQSNNLPAKDKLAAIYQSILALEPNPEIRANVEYRLAQINTQHYELTSTENINAKSLVKSAQQLQQLISEYKSLLHKYPNRNDNEFIRYQLAKALDLQGNTKASLAEIEQLMQHFPNSIYSAELNFRRGDIYYNNENYQAALTAYKKVITNSHNDKYLLNSIYMTGWSLFKLNRLAAADQSFLQVFETMIAANPQIAKTSNFTFAQLPNSANSLASDTQRVLSISLSQQQQVKSLIKLVKNNQDLANISLYKHLLFKNLATFLLKKSLPREAELTYKAYLDLAPNTLWSARFTLDLLTLYQKQGQYTLIDKLKNTFVKRYGINSIFWQHANLTEQQEVLPKLLKFSYAQSQRLYAKAQQLKQGKARIIAFKQTTSALHTYLLHAQLAQAKNLLQHDLFTNQYLYAEANFEAQQYQQALTSYEILAYKTLPASNKQQDNNLALQQSWQTLQEKSAFASTVTVRKLLATFNAKEVSENKAYQQLISKRNKLDKQFIANYPKDKRALEIATKAAQYSFASNNYAEVSYFTDFVLKAYHLDKPQKSNTSLPAKSLKQIKIVTQLQANSLYKQQRYQEAENAYQLALNYIGKETSLRHELRNLLASCIYFQGQALKATQPRLAVQHFLRLGKVIPESSYRLTAEFDAANLLLDQQLWQPAVTELLAFQKRYPKHTYSKSIPAKLAKAYVNLKQWHLAADQLLVIVGNASTKELKREAQYTAAEYYEKAGDKAKALIAFRKYAHTYPQPFAIAQEVRYKMSEFYQDNKTANKRFYWYRKILKFNAIEQNKPTQKITARTTFLAATAAFGLGQAHQQSFNWIKLKAPLKKSLKRKQKEMKRAIHYYQQVLDFKLASLAPHATYNLATLYQQLAEDVLTSQRPKGLDELALEEYEIVIEELAFPFEEKAIAIHLSNSQHTWQNIYDKWIAKSFAALAKLSPALYNKKEQLPDVIDAIY